MCLYIWLKFWFFISILDLFMKKNESNTYFLQVSFFACIYSFAKNIIFQFWNVIFVKFFCSPNSLIFHDFLIWRWGQWVIWVLLICTFWNIKSFTTPMRSFGPLEYNPYYSLTTLRLLVRRFVKKLKKNKND